MGMSACLKPGSTCARAEPGWCAVHLRQPTQPALVDALLLCHHLRVHPGQISLRQAKAVAQTLLRFD